MFQLFMSCESYIWEWNIDSYSATLIIPISPITSQKLLLPLNGRNFFDKAAQEPFTTTSYYCYVLSGLFARIIE